MNVLVPGGTGAVGEGIVRAHLEAGADVVVPTRSPQKADDFRAALNSDRLHVFVHDYTTFGGATELAAEMTDRLGGIDHVVAPIGGWWAGKRLWEVDEADWQNAFVGLATTHLAVARATIPRLSSGGTYQVIVGDSATVPVPGSGLVSMEQSAVLMMRRVLAAEQDDKRIFALVLGPVRTRVTDGDPSWVSAGQIGQVSVAAAGAPGQEFHLGDRAEAEAVLRQLRR